MPQTNEQMSEGQTNELVQPWEAWLAKEQELIASSEMKKEELNLIDQTYLLRAEPSQTQG